MPGLIADTCHGLIDGSPYCLSEASSDRNGLANHVSNRKVFSYAGREYGFIADCKNTGNQTGVHRKSAKLTVFDYTQHLLLRVFIYPFAPPCTISFSPLPYYNVVKKVGVVMIDNLLSGLFASVFVALLTICWEHYKTKKKLTGYCLLLYLEVNDHLYRLSVLDPLCINALLNKPDVEWDTCRHFIAANLPYEEFACILEHYRSMQAVRKILSLKGSIPNDFLSRYISTSESALQVLFRRADLNTEKVQLYNKLRKAE